MFHTSTQREHWTFSSKDDLFTLRERVNENYRSKMSSRLKLGPAQWLAPDEELKYIKYYEGRLQSFCNHFKVDDNYSFFVIKMFRSPSRTFSAFLRPSKPPQSSTSSVFISGRLRWNTTHVLLLLHVSGSPPKLRSSTSPLQSLSRICNRKIKTNAPTLKTLFCRSNCRLFTLSR